jgi:hypothetical protein
MNSEAILKKAAELLGGSFPPTGNEATSNLQAAAALEALLRNAQGASTMSHSQFAQGSLPRSAPTSSLLPPIPSEALTPQTLLALQAQLASVGSSTPSFVGNNSSSNLTPSLRGSSDVSSMQHILATQALTGSTVGMSSSVASSLASDMHKWPLERLGKYIHLYRVF